MAEIEKLQEQLAAMQRRIAMLELRTNRARKPKLGKHSKGFKGQAKARAKAKRLRFKSERQRRNRRAVTLNRYAIP